MGKRPRPRKSLPPAVRHFLADIFKLAPALPEKQPLDVVLTGSTVTAHGRSPPKASLTTRPACIALQNEDRDEDAVVITSLNVIPFCCHADLLTMSRAELVVVADTLNARLPRILSIDVGRSRSAAYIRKSIELLVGLRKDATQTPEAERSRSVFTGVGEVSHSAGSPRLLDNATQQDASTGSVALEDSQEGFRDPDVASHRPQKKRRFDAEATVEASDRPMISRPITRSQSHRVGSVHPNSPLRNDITNRVLRTRSQNLPARKPMLKGIHPNITVARGRSSSRPLGYLRSQSTVMTSTPKGRRSLGVGLVQPPRSPDGDSASASLTSNLASPIVEKVKRTLKRKLDQTAHDTTDLTFGIEGLTMPPTASASDMHSGTV